MEKFKAALCQMRISINKEENIQRALLMIDEAAREGAQVAALPEMFNCPYGNKYFRQYAEDQNDGTTIKALSAKAKEKSIYIIGGSIPEIEHDKIFNTSFMFDRGGNIIGKHRKVHLFDIDIKDKITFKESDVLSPGHGATVVDTDLGKIGIAICYDVRFPELFRKMTLMGAELIILPAIFNMTTGPVHWENLLKIRAVDNQVYVMGISPARPEDGGYAAYGHSMISDPWGDIVSRAETKEKIVYGEIDKKRIAQIREQLPLLKHRREDVY
jgi:omega-amidase